MTTQIRRHAQLPPVVATPLDTSIWEVIVPVARTNLVANGSIETNTTGWSAIGGSTLTQSTEAQYHGSYSLKVVPGNGTLDGALYNGVSLTSGTLYAFSAKVKGQPGISYRLALYTAAVVELSRVTFRGTGRWQWVYGYYLETASNTRHLYVHKDSSADTHTFYLDGAQVEAITAGEIVSTYIDGDQLGLVPNQQPPAYVWNGTPHASTSSRSVLTRAGGMVFRFKDFGFFLSAIIGLGLAGVQNVSTEYARIDGGFDDYTRKPSRQFSLVGNFEGSSYPELRANRSTLASYLDRDLSALDQQLVLRHHLEDQCRNVLSDAVVLPCKYQGGLSGNDASYYAETTPISFTQYLPTIMSEGETGAALFSQIIVGSANAIIQRSASGSWTSLDIGMSGGTAVYGLARTTNGLLYAGGNFTDAGGSGADFLSSWNGTVWSVVKTATSIGNIVRALAVGPDGVLYIAGDFVNADGNADADYLASWNGSAYGSVGTGANTATQLRCLTFGPDGRLYVGGSFSQWRGVAAANNVAVWDGSTWATLGTGTNGIVSALKFGKDGYLYAAGVFTTAGGVTVNHIARWNGSAWSVVGNSSGVAGGAVTANALAIGLDGRVYLGGDFTSVGGVSATNVARFNGTAWEQVGAGLNAQVRFLGTLADGGIVAGGDFTGSGSITFADNSAIWNGAAWLPFGVDLPGAASVWAVQAQPDGSFVLGFDTTGSATASVTTAVTVGGSARTYPTVTLKGPSSGTSRVFQLINYTTNRSVYLNLTMNAGETATFVFQPDRLSFVSDFVGSVANTILPGSQEADFFLQGGVVNNIGLFAAVSSVAATIRWHNSYTSLDGVP